MYFLPTPQGLKEKKKNPWLLFVLIIFAKSYHTELPFSLMLQNPLYLLISVKVLLQRRTDTKDLVSNF